ncbi:MAG: phosphate-starvation-inducible PsiE family protein [Pseudomonadota bacterium]
MKKITVAADGRVMRVLYIVEWIGLLLITLATMVAIGQEVAAMVQRRVVLLEDILLLFIYMEVITMVGLYLTSGKLPVRYPIYIAIVAIARYITIGLKEIHGWEIIGLSAAILVLALAIIAIRYGHKYLSYDE